MNNRSLATGTQGFACRLANHGRFSFFFQQLSIYKSGSLGMMKR